MFTIILVVKESKKYLQKYDFMSTGESAPAKTLSILMSLVKGIQIGLRWTTPNRRVRSSIIGSPGVIL